MPAITLQWCLSQNTTICSPLGIVRTRTTEGRLPDPNFAILDSPCEHRIPAYRLAFGSAIFMVSRECSISGNQYLHRKSADYRNAVRRMIAAYHRHIQLGLIAQGLLQILSATKPSLVWQSLGSCIRTVRPGLAPSEQVVAIALRHTFPEFLATAAKTSSL